MSLFPLEDFSAPAAAASPPARSEDEIDALCRAAYEEGFHAGAADAMAAASDDQTRISAELAARVQELGFTYQEAVAHVMGGVAPVLRALVDSVLPPLMAETVGRTIVAEMEPLADMAVGVPVRILVSPDEATALRHVLGEEAPLPFVLVEDRSLSRGQAHLRLGEAERQIDVSGVLQRISTAVAAVTELNERKIANG